MGSQLRATWPDISTSPYQVTEGSYTLGGARAWAKWPSANEEALMGWTVLKEVLSQQLGQEGHH